MIEKAANGTVSDYNCIEGKPRMEKGRLSIHHRTEQSRTEQSRTEQGRREEKRTEQKRTDGEEVIMSDVLPVLIASFTMGQSLSASYQYSFCGK